MPAGEDMQLTCRKSGEGFGFPVGEQKWYAKQKFAAPVKCAGCRKKDRAEKPTGE